MKLTHSQPDTPIDEKKLYLSVIERDDKGHTYGLGWTPLVSRRRHVGAGFSLPMSTNDDLIEQLWGDIKKLQRSLLRVINDKTLDRDQLQEMQGRLGCVEHALMDRLGISFAPLANVDDS
ncbi:hypothetical protein Scep_014825 [Stephania cephalantha]|uniref:Uncharacterized protein n=1 Tax=Stephania cephalantha TaxID=152367 RepID=A0AAP0P0U9_9MAGN